jgi:hypothetical protein
MKPLLKIVEEALKGLGLSQANYTAFTVSLTLANMVVCLVSSPLQRQQTEWVVFGFAVPITVCIIGSVPYLMFSVLNGPGSLYLLKNL